jgi:glucose-1-phosphate cytidylyltransferase
MKVILLAGGLGTRLSEYTGLIPKPMVTIGGMPILWHIMNIYAKYGHKDFHIALGYKSEIIKEFFINYTILKSDFEINLKNGKINSINKNSVDWNVTLVNTGEETMTGGRIKRMKKYIGNETCLITYGDGVADINIKELLKFHRAHGKMITMSAVRPPARFGELELDGDSVSSFKEKPQLHNGWINGGFFIVEPEFFEFIDGDSTMLEREPLEKACLLGELMAFKHYGFWQCMDTKRDHDSLEAIWSSGRAPWVSN